VTQRLNYTFDDIEWANCILTAGGDGTFLSAASKVYDNEKPVIGINTDIGIVI
jgi:NAD+ kinase